jgi:hypothetical protein
MSKSRKRTGHIHPEVRLKAMIPGVLLLPCGLLIFGFCIHNYHAASSYVGACAGMAVRSFTLSTLDSLTDACSFVADLLLHSSHHQSESCIRHRLLQAPSSRSSSFTARSVC